MSDEAENPPPIPRPAISFKVRKFVEPDKLKADLAYTPANLTDAFMAQASMFAHYGVLYAQAEKQTNDLELLLEATEATVYRRERDNAIAAGEKPTDAGLRQTVSRDKRVNQLKKALNEARQIEATAKIAVEAFKQRRDMLIQQGLISREEMKGELSIREKSFREEVQQSTRDQVLAYRKDFQAA